MPHTVHIGAYTREGSRGIYTFAFEEGRFQPLYTTAADNPSYLTLAGDTLYAVSETRGGHALSFRRDANGAFTQTGCQPVYGDAPCHLCADENHLYVANYSTGSVSVFPLGADGALVSPPQLIQHCGQGINAKRQEAAHAHCTLLTPDQRYLAVCDLGVDCVYFYPHTAEGITVPAACVRTPAGVGPRHLVFGPGERWYLLGELTCDVWVYEGYGARARLVQTVPTLRKGDAPTSTGAAIRLSPDGKLLLCTIRGADTLVLMDVQADGTLLPPRYTATEGKWPRDAAFTPDGRHVLCACEHSNLVTAFAVQGGELAHVASYEVIAPTCVCIENAQG